MNKSSSASKQSIAIVFLLVALVITTSAAAYFFLQTKRMETAEPVEVSIDSQKAAGSAAPRQEVSLIQASEIVANLEEVKEIRAQIEKQAKGDQRLNLRNAQQLTETIDGKKYWTIEVGVSDGDQWELRDTYYVGVHNGEVLVYDPGSDKAVKLTEQRKIND